MTSFRLISRRVADQVESEEFLLMANCPRGVCVCKFAVVIFDGGQMFNRACISNLGLSIEWKQEEDSFTILKLIISSYYNQCNALDFFTHLLVAEAASLGNNCITLSVLRYKLYHKAGP